MVLVLMSNVVGFVSRRKKLSLPAGLALAPFSVIANLIFASVGVRSVISFATLGKLTSTVDVAAITLCVMKGTPEH